MRECVASVRRRLSSLVFAVLAVVLSTTVARADGITLFDPGVDVGAYTTAAATKVSTYLGAIFLAAFGFMVLRMAVRWAKSFVGARA